MIQLARVANIKDKPATTLIHINTLLWFDSNIQVVTITINLAGIATRIAINIPCYQLSPCHLSYNVNYSKIIFENYWQASKVYSSVSKQSQAVANHVIWEHPAETHIDNDNKPNKNYLAWKMKLLSNPYPIRYPNGINGSKDFLYHMVLDRDGNINYLYRADALKLLYIAGYAKLVKKTEAYHQLKLLIDNGNSLCFSDTDALGFITVTQESYDKYLNSRNQTFSHTWVLAGLLLNLKLF